MSKHGDTAAQRAQLCVLTHWVSNVCLLTRDVQSEKCVWCCREPDAGLLAASEVASRYEAMPASLREALMPFQREVRCIVGGCVAWCLV
jgi:methionine synthase I (cobalamin-dependent)